MQGDLTYFKRDAINYYGVFMKPYDTVEPSSDRLTMVRQKYYRSNLQAQKGKFTEMGADGSIYKYNYNLNEDSNLKWKVVNSVGRVLEKVPPHREGGDYCVEIRDNFGKILKVIYFGPYHNWKKTKYFTVNSSEPVAEIVLWEKNGMSAILKYTGSADQRPEILYPCAPINDPLLLEKIIAKLGEPDVRTLCSEGLVFFADAQTAHKWAEYYNNPTLLEDTPEEPAPVSHIEKKIDLTQTDDVIIPEKTKKDDLVIKFSEDSTEPEIRDDTDDSVESLLPSRTWGRNTEENNDAPLMPKLHSDSLIESMLGDIDEPHDEKADVFSILFDETDETGEADAQKEQNQQEEQQEQEDQEEQQENFESDDVEPRPNDSETLEDISDNATADEDEDEENESYDTSATQEFDLGAGTAPANRPYSYKRVRRIGEQDDLSLDKRAKEKTVEFVKQSIRDLRTPHSTQPQTETVIVEVTDTHVAVQPVSHEGRLSPTKVITSASGEKYFYYGSLNAGGERSGRGRTLMHDDLTAYDGFYENDKRHGFGAYYYSNGKICYIGDWAENRRNGVGISFKSKDGSIYVGKWQNNCPVGIGAKFDDSGNFQYLGHYENGSLEGVGMSYIADDGTIFVARWDEEKLSETGTQFDFEGNLLYHGTIKNGKRDGIGTQYDTDGQVSYHGGWKDGMFHGHGMLVLPNGCRISGSFVMGKIEGRAVFTTRRGKKLYEGEWSGNRFNGQGKKYDIRTGSWYKGTFSDGRPVGVLTCYDRDGGLVYEGELRNEQYHGTGKGFKDGKKVYDGEWKNGVRSGTGSEFENGRLVYRGKFKENVRRGIGTSYTADGRVEYIGHWTDGRKDGEGLLYKDGKPFLAGCSSMGILEGRVNEIRNGVVIRECIYTDGVCVYMREFSDDGLSVKYEGYVKDGVYDGMGCAFSQYGEKSFEGIFKAGKPFKNMKVRLRKLGDLPLRAKMIGSEYSRFIKGPDYVIERELGYGSYSGMLVNGRPSGKGTIIYTDHGYTGSFEGGIACGLGVIYEWDGSEIQGTFAKNAGDNTTEITLANGITYHLIKNQ